MLKVSDLSRQGACRQNAIFADSTSLLIARSTLFSVARSNWRFASEFLSGLNCNNCNWSLTLSLYRYPRYIQWIPVVYNPGIISSALNAKRIQIPGIVILMVVVTLTARAKARVVHCVCNNSYSLWYAKFHFSGSHKSSNSESYELFFSSPLFSCNAPVIFNTSYLFTSISYKYAVYTLG